MDPPLIPFGLTAVFVNVLLDQLGLPVPAVPTLIVAGALAADNRLSASGLIAVAVAACLVGDTTWYLAGRRYGNRVMKMLCRVSLTPDSCVSQTQARFERWGSNALLVSKFVPGLSIIAPPLAGATRMTFLRFSVFGTVGSALWVCMFVAAGALLHKQIDQLLPRLQAVGSVAVLILAGLLAGYIAFKWWERRRFYAFLRMARISVSELYDLMDAGTAPLIVDVRSQTARSLDPRRIPGALHVPVQDIEQQVRQLPRDREIVLYCTCPNEASAAKVARLLMSYGFKRVRPLNGGLDAWVAAGYAVETFPEVKVDIILSNPGEQVLSGRRG